MAGTAPLRAAVHCIAESLFRRLAARSPDHLIIGSTAVGSLDLEGLCRQRARVFRDARRPLIERAIRPL